jgi:hypothetical protein
MINQTLMAESKLTIEIKNTQPIELSALVDMFAGLGSEYNKFVSEHESFELTKQTRLYVKEVREGSQIYELVDLVPLMIPFVENASSVIEFTKKLKTVYEFFKGKTKEKPELDSGDIRNYTKIIEPIAKDSGSQVFFNAEHQTVNVTLQLNSLEANAIQNKLGVELLALKEPDHSTKEKEVFYWHVAKGDIQSQTGDRGIIESITTKDLKVIFDKPEIKDKMLNIDGNPFHFAYVVDVKVETIEGKPAVYKIINVHESFPKAA